MGERGSSQLTEDMTTHFKVLSVLSDTADAAIPEDLRSVIQLIREMYDEDPSIAVSLQKMRDARVLRLGDLPDPVLTSFAGRPEWQLLIDFISGEEVVGELGENVLIVDIVDATPSVELELSRKISANMAVSQQLEAQLRKSLDLLTLLGDAEEMQAALFMKKAMSESGFTLAARPGGLSRCHYSAIKTSLRRHVTRLRSDDYGRSDIPRADSPCRLLGQSNYRFGKNAQSRS